MLKWSLYFLLVFIGFTANAQITTYPYVEDFETSPAWTAVSIANSDWAWGTPNHTYVIQSAGSGNKCWSVGGLTGAFYNYWEQSYVVSPVFDFTNLQYPHIRFKLFYDSEYHFDGGNLQYSTNGGTTWTNVGAYNDPVDCNTQNWYNYNSINYLNNPAWIAVKHGWCGNTQAGGTGWDPANPGVNCVGGNGVGHWVTAEHCLTGLAGQPNVLLRFTFGAGFTCNNFDGFAFDSVAISNGIPNSAGFTHSCAVANTVSFTSTYAPCPQTNAWLWNFGDPASGASNTATTQNATHTYSGPGTYTVTLIAKGGACNPPDTVIQVVQVMSGSVNSHTNVACFGGNNGVASSIAANGAAPYSYTWTPSGGNASVANGLPAGNYTLTIADANNCQVTSTVAITQPPALTVTVNTSQINCFGAANGSATVSASGGVAPLSYSWSPNTGSSPTVSGLAPGNYTVITTDQNNCTSTQSIAITQPSVLTATSAVTNPLCSNPGSATITVSGGTGAYSYTWSPSGGSAAIASGLSGGTYTTTVADANHCSLSLVSTLTSPVTYTTSIASASVTCFGGNNGSATVTVNGNTPPYSYTWSPAGGNATTANNLTAGNYSVVVSDVNGCIRTTPLTIQQAPALSLSVANYTVCDGQQATLSVTVSGGTPAYTYSWEPGGSGNASLTITGTTTTSYSLEVTDSHSCTAAPAIISVYVDPPLMIQASAPASVCSGSMAVLTATASGGDGNYQYIWQPSGQGGAQVQTVVNTGTQYTVTVTDGCSVNPAQTTVTVGVVSTPTIHIQASQLNGCPPVCTVFSDSTLLMSGTISGWNWTFGNGTSSNSPTPSVCFNTPGAYSGTLTATAANGCNIAPVQIPVITVYPLPVADFEADSYEQSILSPVFQLTNTSGNAAGIQWIAGVVSYTTNNIALTYDAEGIYPVTLIATSDHGCTDQVTKYIKVIPEFTFYAPNTFTPNGDNWNELFLPMGVGWKNETFQLNVFDRWGLLIFQTNDVNKGWDGRMKGSGDVVQQDVYVWKVELDDVFNKHHSYIGHITVLK
ncbi:MAG: gliding motility-associated C-terminal domain-containing protein [Bacteroidetes bacterium]|nr:gliding motility-associated C-terminal domain-containing protein [Bacteroidota bacterium]